MMRLLIASLLAAWLAGAPVAGQGADALEAANRDFERGAALLEDAPSEARALLLSAVAGYTSALEARENGHLRYNLGNAYALLGEHGRASLEYRRAARLLGADRDLRANAAQLPSAGAVRPSVGARLESAALMWRGVVPVRAVFWAGALAWAGCWLALWLTATRRGGRWAPAACAACAAAGAALMGSLAFERVRDASAPEVVAIERVVGRKGPDERAYEPSFAEPLAPGLSARVVEDRGSWVRLRLRDGRDTWTPRSAVEPVFAARRAGG